MYEYQNQKNPVKKSMDYASQTIQKKTGISDSLKYQFESKSGYSFDDVRVHYNSEKPAQFQALAYTQGNQVYIGPGQEKHLKHELAHVVQQKQGIVRANSKVNGQPLNTEKALERAADNYL